MIKSTASDPAALAGNRPPPFARSFRDSGGEGLGRGPPAIGGAAMSSGRPR